MIIRLVILFAVVLMSSPVSAQEETVLKDQKDKLSYAIGMDIANSFKRQSIDVNPAILSKGMQDVLSGGKTVMTEQEMKETLMAFQKEMMAKQAAMMRELGEKNKKEGEAFLAENKKKEGVVTLPDGLAYKVIKEGVGKKPKATDTVTAHYRGTLVDGSEFDSSYGRGAPGKFPVNGVIPGWTEVLQMMPEGSKWQVFIPSNLAYGERGMPGSKIGPNAALIFEIELLSVEEKK